MILEQALKTASIKIWNELEPVNNIDHKIFEVREEALTTIALKQISKSSCNKIKAIEMISAVDESERGYDFEVAVGSDQLGKYVRFFIQSKRLYGNSIKSSYDAIDNSQLKDLMKYGKREGGLSTYAFFNHLLEDDLRLLDYYNSASKFQRKLLGITLTSAYSVYTATDKKFASFHYNGGIRISPRVYALRSFPHLFSFYKNQKNLAVPFHEIAYLTIELAEIINKSYRRKERASTLPLLLLLFPGFEDFLGDGKELIPITKINSQELLSVFRSRNNQVSTFQQFSPKALVIIDTNEE